MRHSFIGTLFAACLSAGFACNANAQAYPSKPITVIWPYAAGSGAGLAHKRMMEVAAASLGQPLVFEYRGGAGARLGLMAVSKAPPDGYLLSFASDAVLTVAPLASPTFKAEMGTDYEPVMISGEVHLVISGHMKLPFSDLPGWIDYAKKNPGKLTFGSTGLGGSLHIGFEKIMEKTGMRMTHVPYKGQTDAMSDRLEGRVDFFAVAPDVKNLVDAGKLKVLVTGSRKRMPQFPNVATLGEYYPGTVLSTWLAIVAPPRTPRDIIGKVNAAVAAAGRNPEVMQAMEKSGYELTASSPEEMAALVRSSLAFTAPIVKRIGLKVD